MRRDRLTDDALFMLLRVFSLGTMDFQYDIKNGARRVGRQRKMSPRGSNVARGAAEGNMTVEGCTKRHVVPTERAPTVLLRLYQVPYQQILQLVQVFLLNRQYDNDLIRIL